jgi:hypothetical protein
MLNLGYFAYYAKERPSAFIYTGAAVEDGEIYPHHHPKFNIGCGSHISTPNSRSASFSVLATYSVNSGSLYNAG